MKKKLIIIISLSTIFIIYFHKFNFSKSKTILKAKLYDDISCMELTFRENGKCENEVCIFGFNDKYYGKYIKKNDTIIFTTKIYKNNFIPDTILIDKSQNAIFITKNDKGNFLRTKSFLSYFEIIK